MIDTEEKPPVKPRSNRLDKGHRMILNFLGPTSVGKGYLTKQMNQYFFIRFKQKAQLIPMGDAVRNRFNTDLEFESKWGPVVSAGGLVDDRTICPMFDKHFSKLLEGFLLQIEGFHRSTTQVRHADDCGLMGENSLTFILNATMGTCRDRLTDGLKRNNRGPRIDDKAFKDRYWSHQESIDLVRNAVLETKSQVFQIDADKPLPLVFVDILAHMSAKLIDLDIPIDNTPPKHIQFLPPSQIPMALLA